MKSHFAFSLLNAWLLITAQAAPPLLVEQGAPASSRAPENPGYVLRTKAARLNHSALPAQAASQGARTVLNLFPDVAPEVEWDKFERHSAKNLAWSGKLLDDRLSAVTLTTVDDVTLLQVISPKHGHFEVESRGDGSSLVRQFDPEKLKGNGKCVYVQEGFGTNEIVTTQAATDPVVAEAVTAVTVDVLMVYTTKAKEKAGGRSAIVAKAQSAINGENNNFDRSNISHTMRLVHTREVTHVASGSLPDELGWVAGSDNVADIRSEVGADLVAFMSDRDDAGYYGIAFQLSSTGGNSGQAFSAVYYDTTAGVWPHEAGHNFGCQHNSPGLYSYSSGHYWDDSGTTRGTMMSYIGTRIPYFSNPDVNYSGHATGTASRDNARTIDNTGPD
ncbi:MAG: M12 family metallo-peptidase, partial [Verrucomicrobiota bacterium]